jgi:iron complex transport system substrate-binding protein
MIGRNYMFLLILFLVGVVSCNNRNEKRNSSIRNEIAVEDFRGKTIRTTNPVNRVVCLIESALSGIYMLGKEHTLVGVPADVYKDPANFYYRQLDERIRSETLASPGNWDFVSLEQIVGLEPDLVIIWSSQSEAIDQLERFGIPVYGVMLHSFEDVFKEMKDFGILFGAEERAESLIQYTRNQLTRIRNAAERDNPSRVYFMWAQGIHETSGTNSTVNQLLVYAGTKNACTLEQEHVVINTEKLYDWDPDLFVLWPGNQITSEYVLEHPQLQELQAIKKKKILALADPFLSDIWTLKMILPVSQIAARAYPETFPEQIDPEGELKLLYGQKLNLYEQED